MRQRRPRALPVRHPRQAEAMTTRRRIAYRSRMAVGAYRAAGAEKKFVLQVQPNTGHKVNPESMTLAKEWFVRWLKP